MEACGQLHAPGVLLSEKEQSVPLDRKLSGPGCCEKKEKSSGVAGNLIVQPVAYSIYRLSYPGSNIQSVKERVTGVKVFFLFLVG
jgi:hypothetical protein